MIDLKAVFEKFEDEFLKFDLVQVPMSKRPDLHAFLLLDKLLPGTRDMIAAAEHDEFWLDVDCEALAEIASEEQVRDLCCCGVRYDAGVDSLCMFA